MIVRIDRSEPMAMAGAFARPASPLAVFLAPVLLLAAALIAAATPDFVPDAYPGVHTDFLS